MRFTAAVCEKLRKFVGYVSEFVTFEGYSAG
jgi:hypothetical protein